MIKLPNKKILAIAGLVLAGASLNAQVYLSYNGGFNEGQGVITDSSSTALSQTAVGIFYVNDQAFIESLTLGFDSNSFNDAIDGGQISIVSVALTGQSVDQSEEVFPLPDGYFSSGVSLDSSYANKQFYVFATNSAQPAEEGEDWSFTEAGIWTNADWLLEPSEFEIPSSSDIDLGQKDTTLWGGLAGTVLAPVSPIPEPSTYALMMMGVALGYTIYRRRKKA